MVSACCLFVLVSPWYFDAPALRDGPGSVLAQCAAGIGCYLLLRALLVRPLRRVTGYVVAETSGDGRLVLHQGAERVNGTIARELHQGSAPGALVQGVALTAGSLATACGLAAAAQLAFGRIELTLIGLVVAITAELAWTGWRLALRNRASNSGLLDPGLAGYVAGAWVVTSGAPYPSDGVPITHLWENLQRHPTLLAQVDLLAQRDNTITAVARGSVEVSGVTLWLSS